MKKNLRFPAWDIPPAPPKPVSLKAFQRWVTRNFVAMKKAGMLKDVQDQPSRQPVKVRFVLEK